MKLSYLSILLILTLNVFALPPRYQYCVSYCTREDTVFDAAHKPLTTGGMVIKQCTNYIYELRNGDCPPESNQGLNTMLSPTKCKRLKNYNGQAFQGDGTKAYKDAGGIEWTYMKIAKTGETDYPKVFISYAKKTQEFCLEIPLLQYKIVLFTLEEDIAKEGYYERLQLDGTKFTKELIRESLPKEPTNPVE